jgi:hypothetical protein
VEMYQEGSLFMIDSSSTTAEVDAWGTVTTPAGTFSNVLRLKRTTESAGYMYYGGTFMHTADLSTIDYTWFKAGIHTSLITVSRFTDEDGYMVTWLTNPDAAGNRAIGEGRLFRIFPVPADDILYLEGAPVDRYSLYDSGGRLLMSGEGHGNSSLCLRTEQLEPGVCFLVVDSNGNRIRKKILIN